MRVKYQFDFVKLNAPFLERISLSLTKLKLNIGLDGKLIIDSWYRVIHFGGLWLTQIGAKWQCDTCDNSSAAGLAYRKNELGLEKIILEKTKAIKQLLFGVI